MVSCVYQYQQSGKGQTSKSRRETGKEKDRNEAED